ncbi:MAG: hypothetical protein H0W62_03190 [Chitinophagales bacterium]|nr:hypothetical protein [Chitinophagales bacterium]
MNLQRNLQDLVWEKAARIPGMDPGLFRADEEGSMIRKTDFNSEISIYGWCYFHLKPVWEGGNDDLWNIKPLNYVNKLLNIAGCFNSLNEENFIWD